MIDPSAFASARREPRPGAHLALERRARRRYQLLAPAVSCLLLASSAWGQTWREIGPAPLAGLEFAGRAAAIAPSARRNNRYYVAAASGGVWESVDGGAFWRARHDGLPTLSIGALALDPHNDRIVYAGSGEANTAYHSLYGLGLYRSTDRGVTWQVLGADLFSGLAFARLQVSPYDSADIWAALGRAGGTFRGLEGARQHPRRKARSGLYRSTDSGASWSRVRGGLPATSASDVDLDPEDPSRIFAAFGDAYGRVRNGIYRSTNGGRTWHDLRLVPDTFSFGRPMLAIAPSDPRRIYVQLVGASSRRRAGGFSPSGSTTQALLRSDDGGDTWQRLTPPSIHGNQGNYDTAIAVDPRDPDTVFLGGVRALRSRDGGLTFTDITPPHVDLHDLAFDARNRLLAATDGGVYRSRDLGSSWQARNDGLGTMQLYAGLSVHPDDPGVLLVGTQDNGTQLRRGGRSWTLVFGGDGGFTAIDPANPSMLFVEFQGTANLFRSNNGGLSFNQVANGIDPNDRNVFLPPFLIDPSTPGRMLYATHRIYESLDRGNRWQPISGDLTGGAPWAVRALAIAPSDPSYVYAATNDGRLLASRDHGAHWLLGFEALGGWPRVTRQIAIDPQNARVAYAADMRFGGARVLETRDGGETWQSVGHALADRPVNTVAVQRAGNRRFLLAGTDDGVWLTTNSGGRWSRYGSGMPPVPVQDLVVDARHHRLLATTLGRGVWTTSLPAANPAAANARER